MIIVCRAVGSCRSGSLLDLRTWQIFHKRTASGNICWRLADTVIIVCDVPGLGFAHM